MNTSDKLAQGMALSNPFLAASPFAGSQFASSPFASSPFVAQAEASMEVPADAPEGTYTYALVKSAPDVPASEVEVSAPAVEISIRWGASVLHVAHLSPPRSFYVGEAAGKDATDFSLPAERLGGAARAPLALVEGGVVYAVILPGATGSVTIAGEKVSLAQRIASGEATPCADVMGAYRIALPLGAQARVELGDMVFEVSTGNAGKAVAGRVKLDKRSLPFAALSLAVHLGVLGSMAAFMPPMAMAGESEVSAEQTYLMAQAFKAMAEREPEQTKEASADAGQAQGGSGQAAAGESGKMGSEVSRAQNGRYAQAGAKDNPEPMVSRSNLMKDASTFGMVGILQGGVSDPNGVTSPWGVFEASGRDALTANGNMWGQNIHESGGMGGLGLSGVGEQGGGLGAGIGLGALGTIGNGNGLGDGQGFGPGGRSSGRLQPSHKVSSPIVRVSTATVSGRLPPEVIQRTVRQNFGRFRHCYEAGLRGNPNLAGRVSVAFVIGRDGAVSSVQNAGSDMADPSVVSCVVRSFYGLSFPSPENGIVTVTYPIAFSPGN
ncbi:AgmX/PglI C-terminal domain-containing protein [Chondromyces apiculatus]|nr:AgmX/PglI C-terminal domain-containing protein [Chondromyces apiculatus]